MLFDILRAEGSDDPSVAHWCKLGDHVVDKLSVLSTNLTGKNFGSPLLSTERLCLSISKPDQRILIVEDDCVTADLLSHHCSRHRIASHRVYDGAEALRYLLEGTSLWDSYSGRGVTLTPSKNELDTILSRANVLFLDLFLPRVNGLTLLKELDTFGILKHFDVIAMSGHEVSEKEIRTLYSYTTNLLVKPLNQSRTSILFD